MKNVEGGMVSVIVPVYNAEKNLSRCIDSIINQTYKNIEIILIDDGSIDNSFCLCQTYSLKYNNILSFHQKNQGVSSARNYGLKIASGEYVFFCDSDDYLEYNAIEQLVAPFKGEKIDLTLCSYNVVDTRGVTNISIDTNLLKIEIDKNEMINLVLDKPEISGYLWNKMFKLNIIQNGMSFDTELAIGEDLLFCIDYITRCNMGKYIGANLYNYCVNGESVTHAKFNEKKLTYILSLNKTYQRIIEFSSSSYNISILAYKILRLCCSSIFILKIKKIENSMQWKKILFELFDKFSKQYGCNSDWKIKEKIKYYIIKILYITK